MEKKGVVWVSTVLYILISLAILSLVLVSVQPIINKNRDKTICYQSEDMLNQIDSTISRVSENEFSVLSTNIKINRGNLIINPLNNTISFELKDSYYQYSQEDKIIKIGKISSLTRKNGDKWYVLMILDYNNAYNITYTNQKNQKILSEANYVLFFENANASLNKIDIRVS